ncbi:ABC transporter permease [Verrucomicrobiota bacterium]
MLLERRDRVAVSCLVATIALLMACSRAPARAQEEVRLSDLAQEIKQDTEWIAGVPDRSVGSEGHAAVFQELLKRVNAIPDITVRTQEFEVMMPVTGKAELTVLDGKWKGKYPVYPMWPAVVRLNTTPKKGFSGRSIYAGGAEQKPLPARSLRGQIAVMDITAGGGWRRAFAFGAKALLLLGSEAETHYHFHSHIVPEPVYFPRFYLPEGDLAEAFRNGEVENIKLLVRSSWQWKKATNIYALVKGRGGPPGQRALVIGAGYDAVSMVQGMAHGADAAIDAAVVLNLLEHFAANPAKRPFLFVLADAQGINQLGVRRMLEAYSARTADRRRPEAADRKRIKEYQEHLALVDDLGQDPGALARVHESEYKPLHRYVKDVLAGELNDLTEDIPDYRLEVEEADQADKPGMEAQLKKMVTRQNQLRGLQNQILFRTEIAEKNKGEAARVWRTVYGRVRKQMEDVNEPILRWQRFDRMREGLAAELGVTDEDKQPLLFLLGIDLSDAGYSCGPAKYCAHLKHTVSATDMVRWLIRVRDDETTPVWTKDQLRFVNLVPLRPQASASTYTVGQTPTFSSPAESFGLKSSAWQTLEGYRMRCDTSYDRFEFLDWGRLGPQIDATKALVKAMGDPSVFKVRLKKVSRRWKRVTGAIVDRSPGDPVPKVPMTGYMVALGRGAGHHARTIGIRMNEFAITGIDGRFRFDGLPAHLANNNLKGLAVMAFKFDSEGRIARTVSKVEKASGLKQRANLGGAEEELRAMVFDCVEVASPPSFMDVRALGALQKPQILDAIRRRSPEFHNVTMAGGHLCAFVPPDTKWQLLARPGDADPKMLVLNAIDPDAAESADIREDTVGFEPTEPLPTIVELISARDLWRINERRLRSFRRAGISSKVIENIHARAKRLLDEAEQAIEDDDGAALYNAATGALANEMRAYKGVRQTANDIVRAVMILLLGLLPFSIAMERLLFASSHIYRQILLTATIFIVMCIALWSFHPAFRITSQPLMLILAFLIIFLSTMVIGILMRRFESDLEKMRSGRAEESGAGTARGGLISCALTIGIATMRKRKLRTALTGMTVALITFALLSFSSATTVKEFNEFELSADPAPPGIFVTTPNKRNMSGAAYGIIKNMAGTNAICYPRYWWATALYDQKWRLHVVQPETGKEVMLKGGFVLDPADAEMSGIDKMLPDWETFQREKGCYLAPETAAALGLEPGDEIFAGGYPLKFVGTFEPTLFSEKMRTLTGDPYLPVDYTAIDPDERQAMAETKLEDIADTIVDDSHLLRNLDWLEPRDMIVIPRTNGVGGLSMHSVYLRPEGTNSIRDMAIELTQRLDYPVYYSTGQSVNVLAAAALIPKAPRSVVIPLLLAGLIIFNTMLNSIAERKKEIHVYTSLGLAPAHVAGIFIAEAATYGLMGSTFGYIIGQGMATVFSNLGWMGNITLNYSGTQVMWTMTLVLLVVILAALVPAIMAARLASPSKETGWRLPEPDGDTIRDVLPFTVTVEAAPGVQAFLYEYLDAHREGSIGYFSSDDITYLPAQEGRHVGGVAATVWLAPYDLGVRQDVTIALMPSEDDVCDLGLELTRKSGQPKDWRKLNKVFVASLRSQMLGWRNISVERVLGYIRAAEAAGSA